MCEIFILASQKARQLPFFFVEIMLSAGTTLLRLFKMFPNSASYRERAAICAWCAEQTASAEAAALLRYLEQMWIIVAEVAEVVEKNKSHHDPHHLSSE